MTKAKPVRLAFERDFIVVPLNRLIGLRSLKPSVKDTKKYEQILASVRAIGVVEPPAVLPDPKEAGRYLIVDGHLRIAALADIGATDAECVVATDDDTYTYNKRVNRLTATQEHRMIVRAMDRGVPAERLAEALGLDVNSVRRKFRMMDGICEAAGEMLRDTPCTMAAFELLRQMSPPRQVEAAQLILDQSNFTVVFAKALLFATSDEDLVDARKRKPQRAIKANVEQMARLERELTNLQSQAKNYEDTYAANNLHLTIAKTYIAKLLGKPRVVRWLSQNQPDYLEQFQSIAEITSLDHRDIAAE